MKNRWAWLAIAAGLVLMSVRRALTLVRLLADGDHPVDLSAELVALVISICIVTGVALIRPLFQRMRDAEAILQKLDVDSRTQAVIMLNKMGAEQAGA